MYAKTGMWMVVLASTLALIPGASQAALIAHYNGEEIGNPLTDQAGGQTASAVGAGHQYQKPSAPAGTYGAITLATGLGSAVGIGATNNGSWHLDGTESAELNSLVNDFTVAAWYFVPSGGYAGLPRAIADDAAWDGDAWSFGIRNEGANVNKIDFTGNGIKGWLSPANTVTTGTWQHVAATKSSTSGVTLYHNGIQVANVADAQAKNNINAGNDVFGLARANNLSHQVVNNGVLIDEVRVYDTVLDAAGIIAAAEAGQIGPGPMDIGHGKPYSYSNMPGYSGGTHYFDDGRDQTPGAFDTGELTNGVVQSGAPGGAGQQLVGWDPLSESTEIIFDLDSEFLVSEVTIGTHTWNASDNGAPDSVVVSFSTTGTAGGDFGSPVSASFLRSDVPINGHNDLPSISISDIPARYVKLTFDGGGVLGGSNHPPNKWMLDEITIVGTAAPVVIPEPMTMLAVGLGVAGLVGYVRKRKRA